MDGAVAAVAVALRILNHKDRKDLKRKLSVLSVPLWLNKFWFIRLLGTSATMTGNTCSLLEAFIRAVTR